MVVFSGNFSAFSCDGDAIRTLKSVFHAIGGGDAGDGDTIVKGMWKEIKNWK